MNFFIRNKIVSVRPQIIRNFLRFAGPLLLGLGMALPAAADTIVINFDGVDASGGAVDATSYLATYGITLTNVSSPGTVVIYSDVVFPYVSASSSPNFLVQQVGGAPAESFTMDFATPLQSVSFTRIENVTSNLVAEWTATAYSGSTALSSESEPLGVGPFTPATYTFNGPDITSLTISADGDGVAGITSATIDDLTLTTAVPEPSTCAMFLGVAALGLAAFRRMRMAAPAIG
jgi:hypothetical protein